MWTLLADRMFTPERDVWVPVPIPLMSSPLRDLVGRRSADDDGVRLGDEDAALRVHGFASSPTPETHVFTVLILLPPVCPEQGDSLDRIFDNYFGPGFSMSPEYGSDRWLTSRKVVIPARSFHRATRITIPLGNTPDGTPRRDCAVQDPSIERCSTAGAWNGVLTFKAP